VDIQSMLVLVFHRIHCLASCQGCLNCLQIRSKLFLRDLRFMPSASSHPFAWCRRVRTGFLVCDQCRMQGCDIHILLARGIAACSSPCIENCIWLPPSPSTQPLSASTAPNRPTCRDYAAGSNAVIAALACHSSSYAEAMRVILNNFLFFFI